MFFEILFQFLLYKNERRLRAARFFHLLLQPLQPARLQLVIPAQERIQLFRDLVDAAGGVALDIQRHERIMQRHP